MSAFSLLLLAWFTLLFMAKAVNSVAIAESAIAEGAEGDDAEAVDPDIVLGFSCPENLAEAGLNGPTVRLVDQVVGRAPTQLRDGDPVHLGERHIQRLDPPEPIDPCHALDRGFHGLVERTQFQRDPSLLRA